MLDFLTLYYEKGHAYKTIVGYVTMVKKYAVFNSKEQAILKRFMRGVYNLRPPKPKYVATWDVGILLRHLQKMPLNTPINISQKVASLLMILAGTRVNTLFHLKITNMFLTDDECTFIFDEVLKHSRPNFDASPIIFRAFPQEPDSCPVIAIMIFLNYRLEISSALGLFIRTTHPFGSAAPATIARWIKDCLGDAGIDTGRFTAHSCRSASTSAAEFSGIGIDTIRKAAGWATAGTFYRHYRREIEAVSSKETENFGFQLLSSFKK